MEPFANVPDLIIKLGRWRKLAVFSFRAERLKPKNRHEHKQYRKCCYGNFDPVLLSGVGHPGILVSSDHHFRSGELGSNQRLRDGNHDALPLSYPRSRD